ncbi:integral membrane protein, YjbE family [Dyella sp. OK004]|uniref:TerC family protein n=1 Tax=Dyella sp. OK004 TaxID=1855292 RepID=UPI0008F3BB98|nr:TerC family protein [Dyella sp. OK004]SFS03935.1 integral membrane protein, YjbE family [Dyella sp. OK004]
MDFLTPEFFSGLMAIVLLDLVLAGDNAIVIALAARNLPKHLQKKAVFWGSFGAVAVRVALTAVVVYLLKLPGLMLAGGLLLLPIAWKLLRTDDGDGHNISAAAGFGAAIRTIVVADALMGLDNVLAIAGASGGHMTLVIVGLAISVPLVVWGSTLILKLIERFPVIVYIGAGAIAWTAARMIAHDHLLAPWFDAHGWAKYALDALLVAAVCGGGWLMQRRRQRLASAA